MREVTQIRHEDLPEDYADLVQAKVHIYTPQQTETHCFRTLRGARDFIAGIRRRYRFKPLEASEDHENPPDGTYLVWIRPGATIE